MYRHKEELAETIFQQLFSDLSDRKGFELDELDEEILDEIKENWKQIIMTNLSISDNWKD